jgi:23S rRNA (guanosine2251-2'-O)-methyltransferase
LFVYGRNSIEEALEGDITLKKVIIERGKEEKFENLARRLQDAGCPVSYQPERTISSLAGTFKHQGIIGEMVLPGNIIDDDKIIIDWEAMGSIIALDGITDTGNLGAIVRSALLFGFDAVVLPRDNSARITPQAIKSSAGAIYHQKVIYINSLNNFMIEAMEAGFSMIGLAGEAEESITQLDIKNKICYIIGSERKGIRRSVKKLCDKLVSIPTTEKFNSLNASVSGAIAMWEFYRKRS